MKIRIALPIATALAMSIGATTAAVAETPGSITTSVTSPIAVSGSTTAPGLTCTVAGGTYRIKLASTSVEGYTVSGSGIVRGYTGPGNYTATMTFSVAGNGKVAASNGKKVPVTITATGGSAAFTKTGTKRAAPATVTGTFGWTCPVA